MTLHKTDLTKWNLTALKPSVNFACYRNVKYHPFLRLKVGSNLLILRLIKTQTWKKFQLNTWPCHIPNFLSSLVPKNCPALQPNSVWYSTVKCHPSKYTINATVDKTNLNLLLIMSRLPWQSSVYVSKRQSQGPILIENLKFGLRWVFQCGGVD